MPLQMRWTGHTDADLDRVAETRMRCYAPAAKDLPRYLTGIRADPRAKAGDFLLAEDNGQPVGTSTAMDFRMWVRGSAVPCQGVAFVGTVRTHRRRTTSAEPGVASQLMHETLRHARDRGQVLSALMPFRASYYERFGYGVVERRHEWTVPLAILPHGDFDSLRYATPADRPAIAAAHQRSVERGQCDIERSEARWTHFLSDTPEGFEIVDATPDGSVRGHLTFQQYQADGKDVLRITSHFTDDTAAFRRQLHFLASLRDQYTAVTLRLPADIPLNWLLKERQLPHRLVNHPFAECKPITRMQVRVLNHAKLIEAMHLPTDMSGKASVAVKETEGHVSQFQIDLSDGRATVKPATALDITCDDRTWAALVLGDLPAHTAARSGLIEVNNPNALSVLNAFSVGRVPFCEEYF